MGAFSFLIHHYNSISLSPNGEIGHSLLMPFKPQAWEWSVAGCKHRGKSAWARAGGLVPVHPYGLFSFCAAHTLPCRASSFALTRRLVLVGLISRCRPGCFSGWSPSSGIPVVGVRLRWHLHSCVSWHASVILLNTLLLWLLLMAANPWLIPYIYTNNITG